MDKIYKAMQEVIAEKDADEYAGQIERLLTTPSGLEEVFSSPNSEGKFIYSDLQFIEGLRLLTKTSYTYPDNRDEIWTDAAGEILAALERFAAEKAYNLIY